MEKEYYTAKDLAKFITFIENKKKPFCERSARELLSGYPTENKNKLEEGDPKFLKCRKPLYYSEETIRKVLIERKMGRSVSIQDLNETVNDLYLIEKEQERAGKAEDEQTELEGISGVLYGLIKKREDLIKKQGNKIVKFEDEHLKEIILKKRGYKPQKGDQIAVYEFKIEFEYRTYRFARFDFDPISSEVVEL